MCGISGFCNHKIVYTKEEGKWNSILNQMNQVQRHRGPDENGNYLSHHVGFAHTRLPIIDLSNGRQPITREMFGVSYTIIYNGELYNTDELRENLIRMGHIFKTRTDTEVILTGFMIFGVEFIKELNGIFSIAIWNENSKCLYLFRDRLGIKPLFYIHTGDTLIFASEIKALLQYPGIKAQIDRQGMSEIFGLGPARTYGNGVFKNVKEVLPGHYMIYRDNSLREICYWSLTSKPHEENYEQTVEKTSFLVYDSVKRQMISDIPICTFLSGGLDSSIVTSICAKELKQYGRQLDTYSFDFTGNDQHFKSNTFQPSRDRPFATLMSEYLGTNHTYLECNNNDLADFLYDAVDARDLPNMADVESSLLYFCNKVSKHHRVTLTGECADEIFGGYPWFHKQEMMEGNTFPWSTNMDTRKLLLSDDVLSTLDLDGYVQAAYEKSIHETPRLHGESPLEARRREISYLNLRWFMVTLLDRMDRASMHYALEARVPFADHRIVEYLWNVPWDMKCPNGAVKGLLRDASTQWLPDEVLYRKKSPYPKTYHPEYEKLLGDRLLSILADSNAPLRSLVDLKKVKHFLSAPSDYGKPWYGQLMAGPQLIAYFIQINYWLEKYNIEILS